MNYFHAHIRALHPIKIDTNADVHEDAGLKIYSLHLGPEDIALAQKLYNQDRLSDFAEFAVAQYFFLVIHDTKANIVVAVNDPFGTYELFYTLGNKDVFLATDIGYIRENSENTHALADEMLAQLLTFYYVSPPGTLYEGIRSLEHGHLLTITDNNKTLDLHKAQYFFLEKFAKNKFDSTHAAIESLQESMTRVIMNDATKNCGVSLSGGVDSGGFLCMASKLRGDTMEAISFGAWGESSSDLESARKTASHAGANHHEIYPDIADIKKLPEFYKGLSQPISADFVTTNSLILEGFATNNDVIYYGFGTDNILGTQGYSRFADQMIKLDSLPPFARGAIQSAYAKVKRLKKNRKRVFMADNWVDRFQYIKSPLSWKEHDYLTLDEEPYEDPHNRALLASIFANNNIDIVDRFVVADYALVHVYARGSAINRLCRKYGFVGISYPYTAACAKSLLEVPTDIRKLDGWDKHVIRQAFAPYSPEHLVNNKRASCVIPLYKFIEGMEGEIIEYLKDHKLIKGLYDWDRLYSEWKSLPEPHLFLYRLLGVGAWYDANHAGEPDRIEKYLKNLG